MIEVWGGNPPHTHKLSDNPKIQQENKTMAANITNNDILMFEDQAWHRKGLVFDRLMQWDDIAFVELPQVEARPMYTYNNDGIPILTVNERIALVDTTLNGGHVVGTASPSYGIVQFERVREAVEAFIATGMIEGIASFLTIGDRRRMACGLKLKGELEFKGYSTVHQYLNIGTSHDGTCGFVGANALGIPVCANTMQTNLLGLPKMFSVRHTTNGDAYVVDAIREVEAAMELQVEINATIERLIDQSYTEAQFNKLTDQLFQYGTGVKRPIPSITDEGRSRTIYDNFTAGMTSRYNGADIAPIQHTKFGALMAIQGYEQHVAGGTKDKEARHLDRLFFGKQPLSEYAANILAAV